MRKPLLGMFRTSFLRGLGGQDSLSSRAGYHALFVRVLAHLQGVIEVETSRTVFEDFLIVHALVVSGTAAFVLILFALFFARA